MTDPHSTIEALSKAARQSRKLELYTHFIKMLEEYFALLEDNDMLDPTEVVEPEDIMNPLINIIELKNLIDFENTIYSILIPPSWKQRAIDIDNKIANAISEFDKTHNLF